MEMANAESDETSGDDGVTLVGRSEVSLISQMDLDGINDFINWDYCGQDGMPSIRLRHHDAYKSDV